MDIEDVALNFQRYYIQMVKYQFLCTELDCIGDMRKKMKTRHLRALAPIYKLCAEVSPNAESEYNACQSILELARIRTKQEDEFLDKLRDDFVLLGALNSLTEEDVNTINAVKTMVDAGTVFEKSDGSACDHCGKAILKAAVVTKDGKHVHVYKCIKVECDSDRDIMYFSLRANKE